MSPIDYKQIASVFVDRRDTVTRDEDILSVNDCVMVQPDPNAHLGAIEEA